MNQEEKRNSENWGRHLFKNLNCGCIIVFFVLILVSFILYVVINGKNFTTFDIEMICLLLGIIAILFKLLSIWKGRKK